MSRHHADPCRERERPRKNPQTSEPWRATNAAVLLGAAWLLGACTPRSDSSAHPSETARPTIASSAGSSAAAQGTSQDACVGGLPRFPRIPLGRFERFALASLNAPVPLEKGGVRTWYTAEVHVGLKPKTTGDKCASLVVGELEGLIATCVTSDGTLSKRPSWGSEGSLSLAAGPHGVAVTVRMSSPTPRSGPAASAAAKAAASRVNECIEKAITSAELLLADQGGLEVPLSLQSAETFVAE